MMVAMNSCNFVKIDGSRLKGLFETAEDRVEQVFDDDDSSRAIVSKDIPVANFHAVELDGHFDVHYSIGEPSLKITAPGRTVPHIVAGVSDGVLKIGTDEAKFFRLKDVDVYVSSWALNSVVCRGTVEFEAKHGISAENFILKIEGAADVDIEGLKAEKSVSVTVDGAGDMEIDRLETPLLEMTVNGAGDAEISGRADKAVIRLNGAGDIDIRRLVCPDLNTGVHGLGKIQR